MPLERAAPQAGKERKEHKEQLSYCAFLSYSHADHKLAKALSHALERYQLPAGVTLDADLCVRPDPRRIGRVFRDEDELSAGGQISEVLTEALANSAHLIVLCSPHAARSVWVDKEVKAFRRLRPDGKILPVLVGAHAASSAEVAQWFAPALLDTGAADGDGPLAPDVAKHGLRTATLRLVAALLPGLDYDDLVNRDGLRTRRRRQFSAGGAAVLLTLFSTLAWLAISAAKEAQHETRVAQQRASEQMALLSQQALKDGAVSLAARMALHALPSATQDRPLVWQAEVALNNANQRLTESLHLSTGKSDTLLAVPRPGKPQELLTVNGAGEFVRWNLAGDKAVPVLSRLKHEGKAALLEARLVAGLNGVLASDKAGNLYWWDIAANTPSRRKIADEIRSISPDSSGHQAVVLTAVGKAPMPTATLVALPSLATERNLPIPAGIVPQFVHLSARQGRLSLVGNDAGVNHYFTWISDLQGKVRHRFPDAVEMAVNSFISEDGDKLFVFDADGQVTVSQVASGRTLFKKNVAEMPYGAGYDARHNLLAVGTDQGKIYVCDLDTGHTRQIGNDNPGALFALSFNADASTVYGAAVQGKVGAWRVHPPNAPAILQTDPFHRMTLDLTGATVQVGVGAAGAPSVPNVVGTADNWTRAPAYSNTMQLSDDGRFLAIGSSEGHVSVFDASAGVARLMAGAWLGASDVIHMRFDARRQRLVVGLDNGDVYGWHLATAQAPIKLFHGPGRPVGIVPGKHGLLAGFADGTIVSLGDEPATAPFIATGRALSALSGSADGATVLAADERGDGALYATDNGKLMRRLVEPDRVYSDQGIHAQALLRLDGAQALIMGRDARLRRWDARSGTLLSSLLIDKDAALGPLAFGPGGQFAYIERGVAHLVDAQGRAGIISDSYLIDRLQVGADGESVFTVSHDGMVRQWAGAGPRPYAYTDLRAEHGANMRGNALLAHPDRKRFFVVSGGRAFMLPVLPQGAALRAAVRQQLPAAGRELSRADLARYHVQPDALLLAAPAPGRMAAIGHWLAARLGGEHKN